MFAALVLQAAAMEGEGRSCAACEFQLVCTCRSNLGFGMPMLYVWP